MSVDRSAQNVSIDGGPKGVTEEECGKRPTNTWARWRRNGDQVCYQLPKVGGDDDLTSVAPIKSDHIKAPNAAD